MVGAWRRALGPAALLLLAVGCAAGDAGDRVTAGQEYPEASMPTSGAVDVLARSDQATAWTERGLFVSGGRDPNRVIDGGEPLGGAALVDPGTGAVTPLPEPPFDEPLRSGSVAAAVGAEVFLFGERCDGYADDPDSLVCVPGSFAAAVYDIDSGTWRQLELPPELAEARSPWIDRLAGVTTDGLVTLELVPEGLPAAGDAPFWTYSIEADEWRHLADPGVAAESACVAGDRLVVLSAEGGGVVDAVRLHTLHLGQADAGWTTGSSVPQADWDLSPRLACGDDFALVHGYVLEAGPRRETAYRQVVTGDLNQWEPLPALPLVGATTASVWTGDQLLLVDQQGGVAVFDPGGDSWTALDLGTEGLVAGWTGEMLVELSAMGSDRIVGVEVPG